MKHFDRSRYKVLWDFELASGDASVDDVFRTYQVPSGWQARLVTWCTHEDGNGGKLGLQIGRKNPTSGTIEYIQAEDSNLTYDYQPFEIFLEEGDYVVINLTGTGSSGGTMSSHLGIEEFTSKADNRG